MFWFFLGLSAAILTMFSFIPQVMKVIRHKSAKDVSIITIMQLSLGVLLWIIYGIHLKDSIIIMANAVTLLTLVVLIALYFKYGRKRA